MLRLVPSVFSFHIEAKTAVARESTAPAIGFISIIYTYL